MQELKGHHSFHGAFAFVVSSFTGLAESRFCVAVLFTTYIW